jgi:endonuclease/exonuclease/phosphatase family metal-dependent hydrolase
MQVSNSFKVGTFNVLNLVLPEVPYYGTRVYKQEIYQKKLKWIGYQLDAMQADIVGFQEVFHEEALKQAIEHSSYLKKATILIAGASGDKPSVGLASLHPIIYHEVIEDFPITLDIDGLEIPIQKFSRPVLKAHIQLPQGLVLTFLVAHLKSKRPTFPEGIHPENANMLERAKGEARSSIRRLMEALALRSIILEEVENNQHPLIIVGDLNDNDLAVSTQLVSGEPPFRNMPQDVKQRIWDNVLYHTKAIQARKSYQDFYYTHIHNGHHEALDHIMVSQEWVSENPKSIGRVAYVRILNDHLIDETLSEEKVPEWQSDHAQVVASIELR